MGGSEQRPGDPRRGGGRRVLDEHRRAPPIRRQGGGDGGVVTGEHSGRLAPGEGDDVEVVEVVEAQRVHRGIGAEDGTPARARCFSAGSGRPET